MSQKINDEYEKLINKLNAHEPFGFGHFNDGEMQYILNKSQETISRGYQTYSPELAEHLKQAFLSPNPNFYRGIPCAKCFPELRENATNLITTKSLIASIPDETVVEACVFHHN